MRDVLVNNKCVRKLRGSVLSGTCAPILEFASKEPYWDYPRYILDGVIKKQRDWKRLPPFFFSRFGKLPVNGVELNCPG